MSEADSSGGLRRFLSVVKARYPHEHVVIDDELSGDWELAACTIGLERRARVPVIEYTNVSGSSFTVVQNVCASLTRIARAMELKTDTLEARLAAAYDFQLPPATVPSGPVRDIVHLDADVDLHSLPAIRYTETQTHPYLSAACVVALDRRSGALNLSFNRLMVGGRDTLAIHMTPGSHLDEIFRQNADAARDTRIAAFIGSHPLWSLGSLASGSLALDEYSVIGGLLGHPLAVVPGLFDDTLRIPAHAEIALEGCLSHTKTIDEGPYGEAFGYVSPVGKRPLFRVKAISHREHPLFQDIVPGRTEHLTMTGVAVKVHLQRTLLERFACVVEVFLPAPMTVYVAVSAGAATTEVRELLAAILAGQRFVKHAVAFDDDVKIDDARQTQRALALHVQPDRDLVVLADQPGNGLDPSERHGRTTKWGVDATTTSVVEGRARPNTLPAEVLERVDVDAIWRRARPATKR